VVTAPLDTASRELLVRVEKEASRDAKTTASTHLVGGIAKIGSRIDVLLRELLMAIADLRGENVDAFLPSIRGRQISLRRATAGQLLHGIREAAAGARLDPSVRALVRDALARPSVLQNVIEVRNVAAHEGVISPSAAPLLGKLRALIVTYRRDAGFPS